uniref:FHOD1 N-terminal GTPase-binding domain-containing protein n=1 Tax=Gopherus agassizii TaxID=38772 RepID=A0A452GHM4_9SAUR
RGGGDDPGVLAALKQVQFLDDTDPFNSTNFPEPTRPPLYTFREDIALVTQLAGVHRLLRAPHKLDDCTLQLSHNGTYLDLESTLAEQRDELEGFQEDKVDREVLFTPSHKGPPDEISRQQV